MASVQPFTTLHPKPPFDVAPILAYYGRSPLEPLDTVVDGAYRRAVLLDGQPVIFEVRPEGSVDAPRLTLRLLAPESATTDPALLARAAEAVARWWRIEQDPAAFEPLAERDPVLGAVLARLRGARSPLMTSPLECAVWAILGQQITLQFAYKLKAALVERYGERITHAGRVYRLFPAAASLAEADPAELRTLQLSRQKSEYVRLLASLDAAGQIPWDALVNTPSEEAIRTLTAIRGVGRWTAEYVLMRSLGHPDVIPAADIGLRSAIGRAYGYERNATEAEVRTHAEQWIPHRSHAAFAWWWSRGVKSP